MCIRDRFVAAFCASGPFRHVRRLVESDADAWFPWGYHARWMACKDQVVVGDIVELWEVDDTRRPSNAQCLAVAQVDHASRADGYLALTLRCDSRAKPRAQSSMVLD